MFSTECLLLSWIVLRRLTWLPRNFEAWIGLQCDDSFLSFWHVFFLSIAEPTFEVWSRSPSLPVRNLKIRRRPGRAAMEEDAKRVFS